MRRDLIVLPISAISVLVANVLISICVVWVYSTFVTVGRPAAFYEAYARDVAPISGILAGIPLMFLAAYLLGRTRPGPWGYSAALITALLYVAVDVAIVSVASANADWTWQTVSYATVIAAAMAGAKFSDIRAANAGDRK